MSRNAAQVEWRIHLRSEREAVYAMLATADGRESFWAESAPEEDGVIAFRFPNGESLRAHVIEATPPERFVLSYFGGSRVELRLATTGSGGTELTLRESGLDPETGAENRAGWVSVLLALKAAVDFGVDLRNHDPARTWDDGYVDN